MLILGIIIAYVYFVHIWGQKYMKSRPAYDLSGIIKIYNLVQIVINLFIGFYVSKVTKVRYARFTKNSITIDEF